MLHTLAPIAARIGDILLDRRQTIAVADGATGGLILAGLLTRSGATRFCRGGGVVYSLRGRDILLGLPREELAGYESVTEDYARVQAEAIRANFRADWGIAESGAAGPEPHPRGAPAGRTCIAVSGPDLTVSITVDTGLTDRIFEWRLRGLRSVAELRSRPAPVFADPGRLRARRLDPELHFLRGIMRW